MTDGHRTYKRPGVCTYAIKLDLERNYGTDRNYSVQYGPKYGRPKLRCQTVQGGAHHTARF